MQSDVIMLGGVVVAVLGYVALFGGAKKARPPSRDVWSEVAQRRDGKYSGPPASGMTGVQHSMDVRVGHVVVRLEAVRTTNLFGAIEHTTARARWLIDRGPEFHVTKQVRDTMQKSISDYLGLGDADFDYAFLVAGNDNAAIRYVFSDLARKRLVNVLPKATMRSDGEHVTLTTVGAVDSERVLDSLLDVVGDVASAGATALDVFTSLPGAKVVRARGAWGDDVQPELRITLTRGECIARLRWGTGAPVPRLSHPTRDVFPPFDVSIVAGRLPDVPPGMLSEYAIRLLPELDGVALRCKKGVFSLGWTTMPPPPSLLAGAKLLVELAHSSGHVGPFR